MYGLVALTVANGYSLIGTCFRTVTAPFLSVHWCPSVVQRCPSVVHHAGHRRGPPARDGVIDIYQSCDRYLQNGDGLYPIINGSGLLDIILNGLSVSVNIPY